MDKRSKYRELRFVVECKLFDHSAWFEPIAAFNLDRAALRYAEDCRIAAGNRGSEYRTVKRVGRNYVVITTPE